MNPGYGQPPPQGHGMVPQGQVYDQQQGYCAPPAGPGYPPPGQDHHGAPPAGQGYPPAGQDHPGAPPAGQGYPPAGQGYPPPGQSYPPPGQGYPPAGQGYPPPGQGYQGAPPPGQGGYGAPPQQGYPPAGQPMPGQMSAPPVQSHGAAPGQDTDDEDSGDEHGPDTSGFQSFQGYENAGYGQDDMLAPPPPPPPPSGDPPLMEFDSVAKLSQEECRTALLEFVAENCCYGKGAAEGMDMTQIAPSTALHYVLETYCEGRSTQREFTPFRGEFIDGPEQGCPPMPWEIPCEPDELFKDQVKKLEPCHNCHGSGHVRCKRCHGSGQTRCHSCGGRGHHTRHSQERGHYTECCNRCHGDGRIRCHTCGGDGRVRCPVCEGCRSLKWYIQLTVVYAGLIDVTVRDDSPHVIPGRRITRLAQGEVESKNHTSDYILERTDMPDDLVRNVNGVNIFEQTLFQVWPIIAFPVPEVNENSVRLVEEHRTAFPQERWLQQRQKLRGVPVTEVDYKWKEESKRFWVYGHERKVHAPDYPQQCCWGCNIL